MKETSNLELKEKFSKSFLKTEFLTNQGPVNSDLI